MKRTLIMMSAVVALLAGACGSTEEQFRDSLMDEGFTEEQVDCVLAGLGDAGIDPESITDEALGDDPPPQEAVDITVGCMLADGVESLQEQFEEELGDLPDGANNITNTDTFLSDAENYGDDPELDRMFDACERGDGKACDELYWNSPVGSQYEAFGNRCGNRFEIGPPSCEEALAG